MDKTDKILKAIYNEVQKLNKAENHPVSASSISEQIRIAHLDLMANCYTLLGFNLIEITTNKSTPQLRLTKYGANRAKFITAGEEAHALSL